MALLLEEFVAHTARSKAMHRVKVLADSVNPLGQRLTTFEWTYPRFVHAEIMTNRVFSRNTASSRAIPVEKLIAAVRDNPVFRLHWGKNQSGMQAHEELTLEQKLEVSEIFLNARLPMIEAAEKMIAIGSHKQDANRLLEPWMWITAIVSGDVFENMFAQRCHKEAEPHYQELAYKVLAAYDESHPRQLEWGEWHLPLFGFAFDDEVTAVDRPWVSAGRCARVSYLTHDGQRDVDADIRLAHRLSKYKPMHASPLEHPCQALPPEVSQRFRRSNLLSDGWVQLRKMQEGEFVTKRSEWVTHES